MARNDRPPRRRQEPAGGARPRPRPRPRSASEEDPYATMPIPRTASARSGSGRGTSSGSGRGGSGRGGGPKGRGRGSSASRRPGRGPDRSHARRRRIFGRAGIVLGLVALGLLIATAVLYASVYRSLPDPKAQAKGRDQTTRVLDRSGRLIANLFAEQNRVDVPLKRMPLALRQGVVATEDKRFYEHRGVDPIGILRAAFVDIKSGTKAQGGSTITQQYVKQAFFTPERTLKRKLKEAALAYRVEKTYSKDQILQSYLNTIYFGHGAYGVESAARVYFGKHVEKLTLPECALVAGVLRSPGRYSPYLEPQNAKRRRDTVLAMMLSAGYIDQAAHDKAVATPVKTVGLKRGSVTAPYFMEYVKAMLTEKYGSRQVFRGGLSVRTTLDLDVQRAAERAVAETLNRKGDPSAALVAIDPRTGDILAMVGGRDFKTQQFNVAVQGGRQPGSAFKPFVLVTALEEETSPEKTYESGPVRLRVGASTWSVTGAGGGRRGPMRLREATERSVNSVFAQLILKLTPEKVVQTARGMGVSSKITPVPAIALGGHAEGVTPLEMASAYGTLANGGAHASPRALLRVYGPRGVVLEKTAVKKKKAVDPAVAYLATDILRGVIERGTGEAADIGRPAAGKTGTTQKYRDAWFVGYTPELVAAVWVGYPDEQKEMTSVHGRKVTGGSFPADIWRRFMREALDGTAKSAFVRPEGLVNVTTCTETGSRATAYCPTTFRGIFLKGVTPPSCETHAQPIEIVVPKLVGLTKGAALALLKKLTLGAKVTERNDPAVASGIVVSQQPPQGSKGTSATVVTVVVSKGQAADTPPVADFTFRAGPLTGGSAVVTFDAARSRDGGTITGYVWEFGDGTPQGQGQKVSHPFAPGTYDVTLWVTDDAGQVTSVSKSVEVK